MQFKGPCPTLCDLCLWTIVTWMIGKLGLWTCLLGVAFLHGLGLPTGTYSLSHRLWWTTPCPLSCCPHRMTWHTFLTIRGTQVLIKSVLPVGIRLNFIVSMKARSTDLQLNWTSLEPYQIVTMIWTGGTGLLENNRLTHTFDYSSLAVLLKKLGTSIWFHVSRYTKWNFFMMSHRFVKI